MGKGDFLSLWPNKNQFYCGINNNKKKINNAWGLEEV